jgi:hypothetical protein
MAPGNALTGEAVLALRDGRRLTVQLTMREMLALQTELGDDYAEQIQQALRTNGIKVLAAVLEAGLRKHHPEIDREAVLDLDVDWMSVQEVILVAQRRFFMGDRKIAELVEAADKGDGEGEAAAGPLARAATRS